MLEILFDFIIYFFLWDLIFVNTLFFKSINNEKIVKKKKDKTETSLAITSTIVFLGIYLAYYAIRGFSPLFTALIIFTILTGIRAKIDNIKYFIQPNTRSLIIGIEFREKKGWAETYKKLKKVHVSMLVALVILLIIIYSILSLIVYFQIR